MKTPVVRPDIAAEAAVWIARLHDPGRSVQVERDCLAWQARSAAHRLAFERCTDTWVDVAGLAGAGVAQAPTGASLSVEGPGKPRTAAWRWAWCLAPAALAVVGFLLLWPAGRTYQTHVGEQLAVTLQGGSRMTLNTATRVSVDMSAGQLLVDVEAGEALFEVAKDSRRRFVVRVADAEVVAKGTVFAVRYTPAVQSNPELVVSLLEGEVDLRGAAVGARPASLVAGDRVRLTRPSMSARPTTATALIKLDRPDFSRGLAWDRGEAVFDDIALVDAVAEMNRYSSLPIDLGSDQRLAALRIAGVFRTGNNEAFAQAVARLHDLKVQVHEDRLVLVAKKAIAP